MNIEVRNYIDTDVGIYYFKNLLNNKYYIGQTVNIRKRLGHHISNVKYSRYDTPLYRAIHKYGYENFEFGVLQRINKDELFLKEILDFWEKYYIILYNSYTPNGYNQTKGGDAGVLGLKMTEEQRQKISENSKTLANDGRNKIFCYIVETQETIVKSSLPSLGNLLGLKLHTSDLRNLIARGKYILARDLETLNKKIEEYNNPLILSVIKKKISGATKASNEAIQDILDGMTQKEWTSKYNLCKASYSHHKSDLIKRGLLDYTRVYKCVVDEYSLVEYLKNHTKQEAANYFNVSLRRIYKYIQKYNLKGKA